MNRKSQQTSHRTFRFTHIYRMPGEGLIAEFRSGDETRLYDLDGLRYRVLKLRSGGVNADEEEKALAILGSIGDS